MTEAKISFERQKIFSTCRFDTNCPARFDFFVDNKYIIEFDGEQHFYPMSKRFDEKKFIKIQEHDKIKNNWCKENQIPIIRIPFFRYSKLNIEDLLLETSPYKI